MKSPYTLALWITWAVVISLTIVMSQGVSSAQTSTAPPPLTPDEKANWDSLWKASNDESNPTRRQAARDAMTKAFRSSPRVLNAVGNGLSVLGAGQIWYSNYIAIRGYINEGESQVFNVQAEMKPPESAIYVKSTGGTNGNAEALMKRAEWKVNADGSYYWNIEGFRAVISWKRTQFASQHCYDTTGGSFGITDMASNFIYTTGLRHCYPGSDPSTTPQVTDSFFTIGSSGSSIRSTYNPRFYLRWYENGALTSDQFFSSPLPKAPGSQVIITPDVYEVGGTVVTQDPEPHPDTGLDIPADEGTTIIRRAVEAPEWQPYRTTAPEPEPEPEPAAAPGTEKDIEEKKKKHGAVVWDRENADGSHTWRFDDGTEYTVFPDGTQQWKYADGTVEWKFPDGTHRQYDPRTGRELTTYPDGSTRFRQYPSPYPRPWPNEQATPDEEVWTGPGSRPLTDPNTRPATQPEPIQRPDESTIVPAPSPTPSGPSTPPPTVPEAPNYSCPVAPSASLILPPINFGERFPFSLIVLAKETLGQLVGTPRAPVFDLPMIGTQDLSRFDSYMGIIRNVWLVIIGGILMPIMFYRLIKGNGEE